MPGVIFLIAAFSVHCSDLALCAPAICTGDLNELTRQPHSIHKPPGCIGVFECQPARVSHEIGGRAMPAVDIFIAVMGLAERRKPGGCLAAVGRMHAIVLVGSENERDRVGLAQDTLLTG